MQMTKNIKKGVVLLTPLLGVLYIIFSYYQFVIQDQQQAQSHWQQTERNAAEALELLQQYAQLTEARIYHSPLQEDKLSRILSLPINTLHKRTVSLLSLSFVPKSTSTALYSRLGKKNLENNFIHLPEDKVNYLGNGIFRWGKPIFDRERKALGTLEIEFSLASFLYEHFSKNEIQVVQLPLKGKDDSFFTFHAPTIPYVFILRYQAPSFFSFLGRYRAHILVICMFLCMAFVGGMLFMRLLVQKWITSTHLLRKKFTSSLNKIKHEKGELLLREKFHTELLKHKDTQYKKTQKLFSILQERYRAMASQAHAISRLTAKLICEEAKNDNLLKDIHDVSQESNTILDRLMVGYPMRENEEATDIMQSLENVKTLFMGEFIEHNVTLQQKGKTKFSYALDPGLFEIVLHNIFSLIMSRISQNNLVRIEVKDGNPFQVIFSDNGYDLEAKREQAYNVLALNKNNLQHFLESLGWKISFGNKGKFNIITLSVPLPLEEKRLPDNVVNLFRPESRGA